MMKENQGSLPGLKIEEGRAVFDYIKGQFYRVIHVDGAFGGPSPQQNNIFMAIWNERWPIPKQSIYEIDPQGKLGKEKNEERVVRDAIIREVEVGLIFNLDVAKNMRDWLNDKIQSLEKAQNKTIEGNTDSEESK